MNMKEMGTDKEIIKAHEYRGNKEMETFSATEAIFVKAGAFRDCPKLREVYFGLDISRISNGAFADCTSLSDVWFAIIDEDKIVEISDDAFRGCPSNITFHIFGSAVKNKYLVNYASKHGYRVEAMM